LEIAVVLSCQLRWQVAAAFSMTENNSSFGYYQLSNRWSLFNRWGKSNWWNFAYCYEL